MIATTLQSPTINANYTSNSMTILVEGAQHGSLDAFNGLVQAYQDIVYRQALWLLGEAEAAEDAAQEAFIRAYQKINSFHGGPFRPWILRIVSNYCIDQMRRAKVRPSIPLDLYNENDDEIETPLWLKDPTLPIEELVERKEQSAAVRRCLERLAPEYRSAIILVDIQGLEYTEAAAIMGITLGTFKSRLFRARLQLQNQLKQNENAMIPWAM